MVTWQQIGQGEPNPFNVTYTNNSTYSASYGEFVITEGDQVDLPSPSANEAVAVRSFRQTVTITTPSGNIWDSKSTGKVSFNSPRYVILVSDGINWYVQNNESAIGPVIPDGTVDNFEEVLYEDQGNSLSDYYSQNTGLYERQTSVTNGGSYALRCTGGSYDPMTASDTAGLPNYPDQGDTFRIDVRSDGGQAQVGWGYDGSDYYNVLIDPADNTFQITYRTPADVLDAASPTVLDNTWYTIEIQWGTDNSITGRLLDNSGTEISTLSANDSRQTDGGIVFRSQSSDKYYDNYRIV